MCASSFEREEQAHLQRRLHLCNNNSVDTSCMRPAIYRYPGRYSTRRIYCPESDPERQTNMICAYRYDGGVVYRRRARRGVTEANSVYRGGKFYLYLGGVEKSRRSRQSRRLRLSQTFRDTPKDTTTRLTRSPEGHKIKKSKTLSLHFIPGSGDLFRVFLFKTVFALS